MIIAEIGVPTPLSATIKNRDSTRGVRAFIQDIAGTLIGTEDLTHVANGTYLTSFIHNVAEYLIVTFVAYTDGTYTVIDPNLETVEETYKVQSQGVLYENRMSTACKTLDGTHEVIAWANRNGQRQTAAQNCSIYVRDAVGTLLWQDSTPTPDAQGVFRFTNNSVTLDADVNYYIVIEIEVDGAVRTSIQSFFTVG